MPDSPGQRLRTFVMLHSSYQPLLISIKLKGNAKTIHHITLRSCVSKLLINDLSSSHVIKERSSLPLPSFPTSLALTWGGHLLITSY